MVITHTIKKTALAVALAAVASTAFAQGTAPVVANPLGLPSGTEKAGQVAPSTAPAAPAASTPSSDFVPLSKPEAPAAESAVVPQATPKAKPTRKAKAETYKPVRLGEADSVRYPAPLADTDESIAVSDRDFNRISFPNPIVGVHFPAGAPVRGKPVYLAGNKQIMLQFQSNVDKPVQMVTELENGQVVTLYFKIKPVGGIVHNVAGSRIDPPKQARSKPEGGSTGQDSSGNPDIRLLEQVTQGNVPDGFDKLKALPRISKFDKFTAIPVAGWTDGTRKLTVIQLIAVPGRTAVVAPPQFYRPGVTAVLIDGDTVDAEHSPVLYIAEVESDE